MYSVLVYFYWICLSYLCIYMFCVYITWFLLDLFLNLHYEWYYFPGFCCSCSVRNMYCLLASVIVFLFKLHSQLILFFFVLLYMYFFPLRFHIYFFHGKLNCIAVSIFFLLWFYFCFPFDKSISWWTFWFQMATLFILFHFIYFYFVAHIFTSLACNVIFFISISMLKLSIVDTSICCCSYF